MIYEETINNEKPDLSDPFIVRGRIISSHNKCLSPLIMFSGHGGGRLEIWPEQCGYRMFVSDKIVNLSREHVDKSIQCAFLLTGRN